MNICYDNHDEIVYVVRDCPLCEAMESIKDLELELGMAQDAINNR